MQRIWNTFRNYSVRAPLKKIKLNLTANSSIIEDRQPTKLKKELDTLQEQHPNHVLLVQVGMFYEIYDCGNYLDEISNLLNLRIAHHKSSDSNNDHRYMRFAGFPMVSLKSYLPTLLSNGNSVAIVNQSQKDNLSNTITRRVARIITPGTVLDELDTDISTGEFYFSNSTIKELQSELVRIQPKEILITEELAERQDIIKELENQNAVITKKPKEFFISEESKVLLSNAIVANEPARAILAVSHGEILKGLKPLVLEAAAGILSYISENFPEINPVVHPPLEIETKNTLKLNSISIQSLEIIRNLRDRTRAGSLISVIDNTKTSSGSRLLASRLTAPSTNITLINSRLDMINVFYNDSPLTNKVLALLSQCKDVEKALQRIHFKNGSPIDVYNIISTLKHAGEIKTVLSEKDTSCLQAKNNLGDFREIVKNMAGIFNPDNFRNKIEPGTINDGVDGELDKLRTSCKDLQEKKDKLMGYLQSIFSTATS
ncbi:Mismatch repair protein msh3 [Terramyces sp. JEL0728]|nr:Mismatch repair protein msh3 [Terramyces sp. JEL0728]